MDYVNQKTIVDKILTVDEIKERKWTFNYLSSLTNYVHTAASLGLIRNTSFCNQCGKFRTLYKASKRIDGFLWRCSSCRSSLSIRKDSFIEKSHLTIKKILIIIFCWSLELPQTIIRKEIDDADTHTVVEWSNFIREICEEDLANHPIMLGGIDEETNQPKEVEIDDLYFFESKYNRGRVKNGVWIFGAVERGSNLCNVTRIDSRDRDTLFRIINSWILPGTQILSDGWAAYHGLDQFDIKKMRKGEKTTFNTHMIEFMWRKREKGEVFPRIIKCIREQYVFL